MAKNGESLQKISCISAKKSSKLDVLRSFSIIFAEDENNPILHHNSKFAWDDKNMKVLCKSLCQVALDYLNN